MTKLGIDSEGDIEHGIRHCLELAELSGKKYITLAFPSAEMYTIFVSNLHRELSLNSFDGEDMEIEALIILPEKKDDDDELFDNR
jgi:hypothetical protein